MDRSPSRDAVELADGRDVGFAIHAVEPFGDVEDDVGSSVAEALREVGVGLEADHVAVCGESGGDGVDGVDAVPLGELVIGGGGMSGGGEVSPDGDRVSDVGRRRCIGVPGREGVPATTGRLVVAA
jgi:hypothetical protein